MGTNRTSVFLEPILAGGREGWVKIKMRVGCQELLDLAIPARTDEEREVVREQLEAFLTDLDERIENYADGVSDDRCNNCGDQNCVDKDDLKHKLQREIKNLTIKCQEKLVDIEDCLEELEKLEV